MLTSLMKGKNSRLSEEDLLNCVLILIPESISQDKFKKSIYLLIRELYEINNSKYQIMMNIAEKAFNETDFHIYQFNYSDLKNEIRLYI